MIPSIFKKITFFLLSITFLATSGTHCAASTDALNQLTFTYNQALESQLLGIMHELETSLAYWHKMEDSPFSYAIIRGPQGWMSSTTSQQLIQTHITALEEKQNQVATALGTIGTWTIARTDCQTLESCLECFALTDNLLDKPLVIIDALTPEKLIAYGSQISTTLSEFQQKYLAAIADHIKPNHFMRNWTKYAIGTACVLGTSYFMYKNQDKIDGWKHNGKDAITNFWKKHIQVPLKNSKDILFGRKHLKVITAEAVQGSQNSFVKRLDELLPVIKPNATQEELAAIRSHIVETKDSSLLVDFWGNQTKNLLWNAMTNPISGRLHFLEANACLIQLKDWQLNQATLAGQQQWEAQQLNAEILAIFPVVLALFGIKKGFDTVFHGKILSEPLQHRLLLVDKLLNKYNTETCELSLEGIGYLNYHLHALTQYVGRIPASLQKTFTSDIAQLHGNNLNVTQKMRVIDQMYRTYAFLNPLAN